MKNRNKNNYNSTTVIKLSLEYSSVPESNIYLYSRAKPGGIALNITQ